MSSPTHFLSLICTPGVPAIDDDCIRAAREALGALDAPRWLSPRRACDWPLPSADQAERQEAVARLRAALDRLHIDVNIVPAAGRRKRMLIADMDSTIVEQETLDELADVVGQKAAVAAITERAMAGELDFAAALRARIALVAGADRTVLDRVAERLRYVPGAAALVAIMRANGAFAALVSGGFAEIVGMTADVLGFDTYQANRFDWRADRIVGVVEPILDQDAKHDALLRLSATRGLTPDDALAVGDGANDVPMLCAAGMGVAYRAKPTVRARVPLQINHADLTALLYLQGYGDVEISRVAA